MASTRTLLVIGLAGLVALGVKKVNDDRAEAELWAAATDPVPGPGLA